MERIFNDALRKYCGNDYYPWHMPGHKRQVELDSHVMGTGFDVTEVAGLDNLLEPEGVLARSMQQLSAIYGSRKSYYLVNGSTGGILAAISAVCRRGDTIIMGRNCHVSVYHAVALLELRPIYIYPNIIKEYGICNSVLPEQLEALLKEYPECKAVILTSPTYEGILSDIQNLSRLTHQAGAFLIVDEAHGAHLEFGTNAPKPALRCGADLVVESLHKTLPCYTQCGILHIGRLPDWADKVAFTKRVEYFLRVYQSSSPSYLLVANMEDGIAAMEQWRSSRIPEYYNRLCRYREKWKGLKTLRLLTKEAVQTYGGYAYDEGKLLFGMRAAGIRGSFFMEQMQQTYGMVLEMASLTSALAMTSIADTEEAFARFDQALTDMDRNLCERNTAGEEEKETETTNDFEKIWQPNSQILCPGQALNQTGTVQPLEEAVERTVCDFITPYPPGIPILVPGEQIRKTHITYIRACLENGLSVHGIQGKDSIVVR